MGSEGIVVPTTTIVFVVWMHAFAVILIARRNTSLKLKIIILFRKLNNKKNNKNLIQSIR